MIPSVKGVRFGGRGWHTVGEDMGVAIFLDFSVFNLFMLDLAGITSVCGQSTPSLHRLVGGVGSEGGTCFDLTYLHSIAAQVYAFGTWTKFGCDLKHGYCDARYQTDVLL